NREEVRRIVDQLEARGLTTWIDYRDQQPGRSWQKQLETQLQTARAVAVFIGKKGLTFWQEAEQHAAIREIRKRGISVIPTVLAECKRVPSLPPFLDAMHRVDFRRKDPDPLEQLIYGIRGEQREGS
ncbi:MAG TPA: toll/interleukin-1 receptor domain-containing protein, partial [Myxococcaceae bacterium]